MSSIVVIGTFGKEDRAIIGREIQLRASQLLWLPAEEVKVLFLECLGSNRNEELMIEVNYIPSGTTTDLQLSNLSKVITSTVSEIFERRGDRLNVSTFLVPMEHFSSNY